jgi:hypothetical protein
MGRGIGFMDHKKALAIAEAAREKPIANNGNFTTIESKPPKQYGKVNNMEGYLLMWEESGDEIHLDLITPEDYKKFDEAISSKDIDPNSIAYEPIIHWFTQTRCTEPWPFGDCKILGTICIARY